jgi:hypothetical protein
MQKNDPNNDNARLRRLVAGIQAVARDAEVMADALIYAGEDDPTYRMAVAIEDDLRGYLKEWEDGGRAEPDEQSGATGPEPRQVVRCSEWLERLRVIHMGALAALAEAVGTDRLHRIIGSEIGADLVRAGMLSRYEELGPTDEDGESFIVYELTEAGAAAGLAWGKAMRHGRSNDEADRRAEEKL